MDGAGVSKLFWAPQTPADVGVGNYATNALNQITARNAKAYSHDDNGNLTAVGDANASEKAYGYTADNILIDALDIDASTRLATYYYAGDMTHTLMPYGAGMGI